MSRRQRTTPLDAQPPSSWSKCPAPASRRKVLMADLSLLLMTQNLSVFSRTRTPSNPTSPSSISIGLFFPNSTGASPFARPHSRTQYQPFTNIGIHYFSPDWDHLSSGEYSPDMDSFFDYPQKGNSFARQLSSLPMPRSASDSDSGENGPYLGLVTERSATSSTLSLKPTERLEASPKANAELGRKLIEAERTLENRLNINQHDMDLDEMQGRLEELKSGLTSTKLEEVLRTKGVRNR
ncbi:uncharacterized protein HD556DRAFT_760183 [Suillus plorans]|uniref:Uncharacterized protein n=1 Tax=Suillus plorans TaxID=116603 RepID=A0A9P7AJK3_9AGAM|nr:uncharacterized protein HD556DRAFT_760183 [Suillus plorans]KAG1789859.1 hypothetical protein HD556DRAFT_760183 [Suillus plorans]